MKQQRLSATISNVGTSWTEAQVDQIPDKIKIIRVRAHVVSGTGTQVALSVREQPESTQAQDTVLEYSLTPEPLDSSEEILAFAKKARHSATGSLYILVKCNTAGNEVVVKMDYEY